MRDSPAGSSRPDILAKNLVKHYGRFAAVDGIDFYVGSGECFGFLGPNGAGKTSTMRMIGCVSPITSGKLEIFGLDATCNARTIKGWMGSVPQENNLDTDLSVLENLLIYASYFNIPANIAKQRAAASLELFQLADRGRNKIDELSGGMKRRLLIARALINQPQLLLLDEPTTGLDPQARHLVWQKLRYLKSEGVTLVLTTHYMEEAAQICDKLVIMNGGKILSTGTPTDLVERHVGQVVLEVPTSPETHGDTLSRLAEFGMAVEEADDRIYLFGDNASSFDEIRNRLDGNVRGLIFRPATLEDVFLKLAGRGLTE